MKTIHKLFLLAVCMLAMSAFAQQNPPAQGGNDGQGHHRRGMPSVDDQVKHLTEQLSLTDDQQSKVKAIVQDTHDQMTKLMQDESLSREDKMTKARSLHEAATGKIRDILTDEQKKKFDDMQKEMQEHMHQRREGGDSSNPK
ncbi:MAG TPA: Spy/CpxP family protein refolding chaperone [Candidatus Angelobacter sp.]|nr:Spy/CpxP family protein refolding chaperone [Candidatus Angelobacter sp.]